MIARRPLVALLLLAAALCAAAPRATAQSDRFAGWDRIVERDYRFDPDEREIRGFSVRASTGARAAFDTVEEAFAADDPRAAGAELLRILREYPQEVVQVGGGFGAPRWVGAAEWAVYQLERRLPESVRASLAGDEERAVLEQALAWRDQEVLRRLAVELEPLPEGRRARRALVRLLREAGRAAEADAVERRAAPRPADDAREVRLPARPERTWSRNLAINRLAAASTRISNPFTGRPNAYEAPFAPVRPVIADGVAYVSDSLSLRAFDLVSSREHWAAPGPIERAADDGADVFDYGVYAMRARPRAINPFQVAQPTLAGDRVLVSLQVAEERYTLDSFDGHPINYPLPHRRLRAFDRHTGELLWTQERPSLDDEAFVNRFDAVGPPVVVGDRVWVSGSVREGALSAWAVSFDLATGALRSRTLLCTGQQELTMFNRPFHEHLVSPIQEHDGALYVSTNLGVVGCVDAFSGRPRWLAAYEVIPREGAVRMSSESRQVHWLNRAPFVRSGVLVVAPLDSEWVLGLDATTGQRRHGTMTWLRASAHYRRPVRHQVLPLDEERMLMLTRTGVECRSILDGSELWGHRPFRPEDEVVGRAILRNGELLVPTERDLLVVDPEDGSLLRAMGWPAFAYGVDIQVVDTADDVLLFTDGGAVHAVVDDVALRERLDRAPELTPRDRLQLAELDLLAARHDRAYEGFDALAARAAEGAELARGLGERARSGRLAAALAHAELRGGAAAWVRALEACDTPERLRDHAPRILDALAAAGADDAVLHGLERLTAVDPRASLALAGEAPQPASVLRVRFGLAHAEPAAQVAMLQELVEADPPSTWNGRTVAEEARRLQGELLATHGRELYAPQERAAREALESGVSLDDLSRRYAHAGVVREAERAALAALLESGRADDVLQRTAGAADGETRELRARAAEQLGERDYAALLRGGPALPRASLPRLPADDSGGTTLELHPRHDVEFRPVTGRPAPDFEGFLPGFVETEGTLFVIDTRRGALAWGRVALPGGVSDLPSRASFHLEGDQLVLRGRNVVQARALADGSERWTHALQGDAVESLAGAGLFLTLQELRGDRMEVVALGAVSGAEAFSLVLDDARDADMRRAGRWLVLSVDAARDRPGVGRARRLVVVDLADGGVVHQLPLDADLELVGEVHDPPRVLLAGRLGTASRLLALDPASGTWAWESEAAAGYINSQRLLADGAGGHVLLTDAPLPGSGRGAARLNRVDALRGVLPPAALPLMGLVDGHAARAAPQLLLQHPDVDERLVVVRAHDLQVLHEVRFLPGELPAAPMVHHAADGFALIAQTHGRPMKTALWVVRGPGQGERYSIDPGEASRLVRPQIALTDGALAIATYGTVRLVRSNHP